MEAALRSERLAREEAEQSLQAEREVMHAVQLMQRSQTEQRRLAHEDARRVTAEVTAEAAEAAQRLGGGGSQISQTLAAAEAANRAVLERGSDTWRKLGQEIMSLETNIEFVESMLLPEDEEEDEDGEGGAAGDGWEEGERGSREKDVSPSTYSTTADGSAA